MSIEGLEFSVDNPTLIKRDLIFFRPIAAFVPAVSVQGVGSEAGWSAPRTPWYGLPRCRAEGHVVAFGGEILGGSHLSQPRPSLVRPVLHLQPLWMSTQVSRIRSYQSSHMSPSRSAAHQS